MPHATLPHTGFQAVILCGPGEGLNPFNANPKDHPKALIPIANRPMVWYPLDWCYKTGITNITLITPPDCQSAIANALSQNPYLTSLPTPKPTLLSPAELTLTTGTAEILRLPEVQNAITTDFVVLPCDLVCEVPGLQLLESWMTHQGSLDAGERDSNRDARRGGLGVWYQTRDMEIEGSVGVKKEETDFLAVTEPAPSSFKSDSISLIPRVRQVVLSMPTATLHDLAEETQDCLRVRRAVLGKHGSIKLLTTYRDAHIYFFPFWVKSYILRNESFESLGEDALGYWIKAGWQEGLSKKLQIQESVKRKRRKSEVSEDINQEHAIDMSALVSKKIAHGQPKHSQKSSLTPFATRVRPVSDEQGKAKENSDDTALELDSCPQFLSYTHEITSSPAAPVSKLTSKSQNSTQLTLIRRIDTAALLLNASLYLARLPPISESSSPYSHPSKIHQTTKQPERATITGSTTLVDANCTLAEKITLKDAVVGASCTIETMCRINRCVLMDGTTVGEKSVLTGCVVGRRAKIEPGCDLKDCQISDGYVVAAGTVAKGEVFAGFDEAAEGFSADGGDGMDLDDEL